MRLSLRSSSCSPCAKRGEGISRGVEVYLVEGSSFINRNHNTDFNYWCVHAQVLRKLQPSSPTPGVRTELPRSYVHGSPPGWRGGGGEGEDVYDDISSCKFDQIY